MVPEHHLDPVTVEFCYGFDFLGRDVEVALASLRPPNEQLIHRKRLVNAVKVSDKKKS